MIYDLLLRDYGAETAQRIVAGFVSRPVTLRFNPLKISSREGRDALSKAGLSFFDVPWYSDAVILEEAGEEAVRSLPLYGRGEIYLQSLSSMLPPLYLAPEAGESILDMTAAPGGKTTQMLALSEGKALITACERDKIRFERLHYNLEKQGAGRVTAMCRDALQLDEFFSFDKILLDAPCSGSGTCRAENPLRIDDNYIEKCAVLQEKLLKKAIKLLKRGGSLIYSTCSVMKRENEEVVSRALKRSGARLGRLSPFEGIPTLPSAEGTVCVCPDTRHEGFFVAKIIKD